MKHLCLIVGVFVKLMSQEKQLVVHMVNVSLSPVNPRKEITPSLRVGGMSLRTGTHKELFAHVLPLLFYSTKHTGFPMDLTGGWRGRSMKH